MIRRSISLLILGILTGNILAQSNINVEDISSPNEVFANSGDSALVVVRGHKSIKLMFYLSKDKDFSKSQPLNPSKTDIDFSDDYIYYFRFPMGTKHHNQTLSISSSDGSSVPIDIDLHPKQVKRYRVTRPFGFIDEECYSKHSDKAMEELGKGNYEAALEELRLANDCYDKDSVKMVEITQKVNAYKKRRIDADDAYENRKYNEASESYRILWDQYPLDTLSERRYKECQNFLTYDCNKLYNEAIQKYNAKDYDNAVRLFDMVIKEVEQLDNRDNRNEFIINATEWKGKIIKDINQTYEKNRRRIERKQRRSIYKYSLTYEYRKDTPVGFSYSTLKEHNTGGFIQVDLNSMLLNELRSKCKYGDTKFSELNLAFGWTKKLFKYAFFHFGPGITFKFYHGTYKDSNYPKIGYGESDLLNSYYMGDDVSLPRDEIPEKYEDGWKRNNCAIAISPVVGIDIKIQFVVLRLSYQYRFATQSKLGDFIGRSRISFGLGVAF